MHTGYPARLKALLSPVERTVLNKLRTPHKIQDFLDALPVNFELGGDTILSPRQVLREGHAHCVEGALLAAAALAYHGRPPLLMDIQTTADDYDHVVALFWESDAKGKKRWGAISKTNHSILRWRDPVYASVRELAMSYFHEYFLNHGRKTMRAHSLAFDLSRHDPAWVVEEGDLSPLIETLDDSPHLPIAEPAAIKKLRKVSKVEIKGLDLVEWAESGKRKHG